MNQDELKIKLEQHAIWLLDNSIGEQLNLRGADLSGANLRRANLSDANLNCANLRDANLSGANLRRANLSDANLRDANLCDANLSDANLNYANLRDANLNYANLRDANLRGANLRRANLSDANLNYADLSDAIGFKFKPIQIVNTKYFVTILDDRVLWGCKKMNFKEVEAFQFYDCTDSTWDEDEFKLNKKIVTEMIRYYRKGE